MRWKTLLERIAMLAVWLVALIFVGDMWPAIFPPRKFKKVECRAMMISFIKGLEAYHKEYDRFPPEAVSATLLQTRGKILITLHVEGRGHERASEENSREINFYDPPLATGDENGLYYNENKEPMVADPWGTPLYFMVSPDEKNEVPNPDPRDRQQNPKIKASVIVYSAGPDRNPETWEDNILSWK